MAAVYGLCFRFGKNLLGRRICHKSILESIRYQSGISKNISYPIFHNLPTVTCFLRCFSVDLKKSSKILSQTNEGIGQRNSNNEEKEEEEELRKKRDANWRTMKYSLIAMGSVFGIFGSYLVFALGSPPLDENGNPIEDEFSSLPAPIQFMKRMLRELQYYNKMIKQPSRDKLLPDPLAPPYIQPKYTLVLEMSDLLVHPEWTYQTGWRFKKRPGVDKFLEQVALPMFEVVVFTADQGMTVFPILDALDPNGYIMYRLVRDSTDFVDGHHVKNLDCLNRDLSKVVVIDWNQNSVKFHRNNAFIIPRWKGNDDDTTLVDLAVFLRTIATSGVEDVRDVLTYYSQYDNPIEAFRENQRKLLVSLGVDCLSDINLD
ncbi:mitochondrial import inner membrane translocase subunit TIM50-C-like isoform X2 [Lycorma delicatula]|uniref:mitochondrial import inner membrane translocase subunit TIM50-C-like isoform X2 n=1 Tax=Lycorma delicatula TaxID=130591 RepID=UPI003F50EF93